MKRGLVYIIIVFVIGGAILFEKLSIHRHIVIDNISSIKLWGTHMKQREASEEEKEEIVKAFNAIKSIRRNRDFAGTTPDSGIEITLNSGDHIGVISSGKDFEIQRDVNGKWISYWGKNKYIKALLDKMAGN